MTTAPKASRPLSAATLWSADIRSSTFAAMRRRAIAKTSDGILLAGKYAVPMNARRCLALPGFLHKNSTQLTCAGLQGRNIRACAMSGLFTAMLFRMFHNASLVQQARETACNLAAPQTQKRSICVSMRTEPRDRLSGLGPLNSTKTRTSGSGQRVASSRVSTTYWHITF